MSASRRVLLALLALLLVLDLARPYLGPGLKPWQWLAGLAVLGALGWWLRARGRGFGEALPVLGLAAFLLPTYIDHSRDLESDGIHYYTYLRSLLFDRDLSLDNDYRLLGWEPRAPNVLPVGAAIVWSPLVVAVHLFAQAARLLGAEKPTGVEPLYQGAACLATLIYGAAGLFLLLDTLRRWTAAAATFWATVMGWIGSPLRFYLSVLPGLAHGAEFFAATLVLRAYLSLRDRPDRRRAALCGAACGLVFLLRSQDGILLALPGLELLGRLVRGPDRRRGLLALLALGGAFLLVALPQLAMWQAMFGAPVLIPHEVLHGEGFMRLEQPNLAGTLVSPRGGLFVTYPALLAAVFGLLLLAWRDARYVAALVPVLLTGWYINSTVFDWYHVRRFTGLVPLLAPGLAVLLAPLTRAGVVTMAALAFLVLRYDLAIDSLRSLPGEPVPVRTALRETGDALVRDGYRLLEPRAPRVAVALLSSYTGEGVLDEPVTYVDLAGDPALLRLPRRARNLSAVTVEEGVASRWVNDVETRVFLPLASRQEVTLTVRAKALETREPQVMEAVWNEVPLGRQEMATTWADYGFHVPAEAVRLGTNVLVLRFDRTPIYRRVRGVGPREVRPAALATLTLHRGPG